MAHPKAEDNDIVVKNIYASICGTDYELKIPTNLKSEFRLVGIFLLILHTLATIIKSDFRLAGGALCHIYKER